MRCVCHCKRFSFRWMDNPPCLFYLRGCGCFLCACASCRGCVLSVPLSLCRWGCVPLHSPLCALPVACGRGLACVPLIAFPLVAGLSVLLLLPIKRNWHKLGRFFPWPVPFLLHLPGEYRRADHERRAAPGGICGFEMWAKNPRKYRQKIKRFLDSVSISDSGKQCRVNNFCKSLLVHPAPSPCRCAWLSFQHFKHFLSRYFFPVWNISKPRRFTIKQ